VKEKNQHGFYFLNQSRWRTLPGGENCWQRQGGQYHRKLPKPCNPSWLVAEDGSVHGSKEGGCEDRMEERGGKETLLNNILRRKKDKLLLDHQRCLRLVQVAIYLIYIVYIFLVYKLI
jgi:hypothetical protein